MKFTGLIRKISEKTVGISIPKREFEGSEFKEGDKVDVEINKKKK